MPFDQTAYNRRYYALNRAAEIARVELRRETVTAELRRIKDVACADCGRRFPPYVMDFDHRDPSQKLGDVMGMAGKAATASVLAEAGKCDIVCANCHTLRTLAQPRKVPWSTDRETARKRASWRRHAKILWHLRDVPCADCGCRLPPEGMQFDHRDPSLKRYRVTSMIGRAGAGRILEEAAKCDIVCPNCHRERTFRRRQSAGVIQRPECEFSKLDVTGSSPVSRSEVQLTLFSPMSS